MKRFEGWTQVAVIGVEVDSVRLSARQVILNRPIPCEGLERQAHLTRGS